jgi:peptide/nickel transport system permease protein
MKMGYFFFVVFFFAVFGDWIANEKPLYCRYQGENYFPIWESPMVKLGWVTWPVDFQYGNWRELKFEKQVKTLIPYSPETIDRKNLGLKGPFDFQQIEKLHDRHWMGTDKLGRDVLSGWIRGFRMALSVGLLSVLMAGFIGIFLGGIAGFYGNERLKLSLFKLILLVCWIIGLFFWISLGIESNGYNNSILYWLCIWMVLGGIGWYIPSKAFSISIPIDWSISLLVQAMDAIPSLFFLFALLPLIKNPGIFDVIVLIACVRWTGIARLVRAEFLRIRDLEFIQSAKLLGIHPMAICWKHILPNALSSLWITFAYSFAGAILLEAYLGYLGIGMPPGTISWGSQMQQVRESPSAWWLAVFPGFAIFMFLFNLLKMGEKIETTAP